MYILLDSYITGLRVVLQNSYVINAGYTTVLQKQTKPYKNNNITDDCIKTLSTRHS